MGGVAPNPPLGSQHNALLIRAGPHPPNSVSASSLPGPGEGAEVGFLEQFACHLPSPNPVHFHHSAPSSSGMPTHPPACLPVPSPPPAYTQLLAVSGGSLSGCPEVVWASQLDAAELGIR